MCSSSFTEFVYNSAMITNFGSFMLYFQIIHTEAYIGQPKVKSAAAACRSYDTLWPRIHHINFHGETETESLCEVYLNCL